MNIYINNFQLHKIKKNRMHIFLLAIFLAYLPQKAFGANMACQEVRYAYSAKGMNVYDVPLKPQTGKIYFLVQIQDYTLLVE